MFNNIEEESKHNAQAANQDRDENELGPIGDVADV